MRPCDFLGVLQTMRAAANPQVRLFGFGKRLRVMAQNDEAAVQALVRAYIACRLAIDALPDLPDDVRTTVEHPITVLCHTVGPALERVNPGFFNSSSE